MEAKWFACWYSRWEGQGSASVSIPQTWCCPGIRCWNVFNQGPPRPARWSSGPWELRGCSHSIGWGSCSFPLLGSNLQRCWSDWNHGLSYLEGLEEMAIFLHPPSSSIFCFSLEGRIWTIDDWWKSMIFKRLAFVQLGSGALWSISLPLRGVK